MRPLFRIIACASAVVGLFALAGASDADARSLEKELEGLAFDHPQIKAARKSLEAAGEDVNVSRAAFLPKVSLDADTGPVHIDSPAERSSGDQDPWMRPQTTASLTIEQNLFDGFSSTTQLRTAELNRGLARISMEGTKQNTLFEGIQAYVDVLRQRRLIGLSREAEKTIQQQLDLEDERVQRGSGVAIDVLQAKSRLQLSKERRVAFEGALENAISRYIQVFNHAPSLDTMFDPAPIAEMIPSELDRVIDIATRENPAVGNSDTSVEVARERRENVKSGYYPSVDLVAKGSFEKHKSAVIGARRDGSVLLQTSWELFSGGATQAEVSKATFNYQAAKDNLDYTHRKVIEQARLAWQSLITSRQRLQLLENAVSIAGEVFTSRKALREAGKETVLNVLDSENEVTNAQINYVSALYDERIAIYQLLLAMGRLNPETLKVALN